MYVTIVRKGLYHTRTRCMCMSVELPFAPVDTIIRGKAGELRVSAGAAEELAYRIQTHGATLAVTAAKEAAADDRKTLMAADFDVQQVISRRELELPIAPIDRIARLRIDNRYRVSMDARIALADILEDYANNVANAAAILARHADRRTIQAEDIETYFQLFE
ncbi:MAG: histones H3 and H4 [Haloquadratum walsbyi J07HQW2]|uniref:Histones H3 and H4 n=2 Tax=Haloquadratum walsbyi TaxID=293091 RepID=U1NGE3_9EURY|nr:MAG: histones H3 and H4 [Haloquadratum walsbyi J07HQW2]